MRKGSGGAIEKRRELSMRRKLSIRVLCIGAFDCADSPFAGARAELGRRNTSRSFILAPRRLRQNAYSNSPSESALSLR
jgi:hypothetical protein